MLPKQRNTIEAGGWPSNHLMHGCFSPPVLLVSSRRARIGRIGHRGGTGRRGGTEAFLDGLERPCSSSANVLIMMPLVSKNRRPWYTNQS
uniref:Uncharacterized protein n=1 Tax=Musa acuminata subsp. malaccensis TaxID=214687 RepID=A0A804IX45_MUSAM